MVLVAGYEITAYVYYGCGCYTVEDSAQRSIVVRHDRLPDGLKNSFWDTMTDEDFVHQRSILDPHDDHANEMIQRRLRKTSGEFPPGGPGDAAADGGAGSNGGSTGGGSGGGASGRAASKRRGDSSGGAGGGTRDAASKSCHGNSGDQSRDGGGFGGQQSHSVGLGVLASSSSGGSSPSSSCSFAAIPEEESHCPDGANAPELYMSDMGVLLIALAQSMADVLRPCSRDPGSGEGPCEAPVLHTVDRIFVNVTDTDTKDSTGNLVSTQGEMATACMTRHVERILQPDSMGMFQPSLMWLAGAHSERVLEHAIRKDACVKFRCSNGLIEALLPEG